MGEFVAGGEAILVIGGKRFLVIYSFDITFIFFELEARF